MVEPVSLPLVDHLVVYGFQYLLVCLFFLSELSYVKQDVPVQTSRRTVHSIFSAFLVLVTLAGVVVAAFRLVDDSVAVWRDGIEAISLVGILFLQIYSIRRIVDHIYLFTFWTLRTLALSMDVAFDRTEWYDFMHLMLAFAWLCACGIRSYSGGGHDSSTGSNTPRKPNFIRGLFFSWMDSTYREAHRGSVAFYQGTLFQGTLPEDRRCEQLLELYEKANARRGYTAVDDGSGRMESERCRFTIGKLLSPFRGEIILAGLNRFVLISLFFLCPYLLR